MQVNLYGVFVLVLLILLGFVVKYIIELSINSKYKKLQTTTNAKAVKNASLNIEQKVLYLPKKSLYWSTLFEGNKSFIFVSKSSFVETSIFDQVNTMFSTFYFLQKKKTFFETHYHRFLLFFVAINIGWSLVFFFLPVFLPFVFVYFLLIFTEFVVNYKSIKMSFKKTLKILCENTSMQETALIKKYAKWLNLFIFTKYISVFSISLIDIMVMFKKWGK